MKFRQKNALKSIIDKVEIKPFILPGILEKDESTISHVKRIGGQVMQFYSMHTMDAEIGGNDVYYYLLSDIYSIDFDEDNSKHGVTGIDIKVVSTRREKEVPRESHASTKTAKFFSMDLYKEITYTNRKLPTEVTQASLSKLISFDLTDNIRYTRLNAGMDYHASTGAMFKTISLEEFPFLVKSVSENTKTETSSFEINISA